MHGMGLIVPNEGYDYQRDPGYSQESGVVSDLPWWEKLIQQVGSVFHPSGGNNPPVAAPSQQTNLLPYIALGAVAFLVLSSNRRRR